MASTKIDIIAKNKASAALGKVNRDVKKISTSSNKLNSSFTKMRSLALGVGAALGGITLAKGFLDTAKQFEQLGIQLKFITGNAKDGAKALKIVEDAAKRSAFSLESMAQATPLLLTVSTIEQLNDTLDITGDIAAATGLSFEEVAGQLQRAFSGGIAAADIFREKGIKAMLGFEEGVQYSADETERIIRDLWENSRSVYVGAMEAMSKTWTGQVSMMGDAWLDFKKVAMEEGVFDVLKEQLGDIQTFVDDNKTAIDDFARALGTGIAESILAIGKSVAFVAEHWELFTAATGAFVGYKLAGVLIPIVDLFIKLSKALKAVFISSAGMAALTGIGWKQVAQSLVAVGAAAGVLAVAMRDADDAMESTLTAGDVLADIEAKKKAVKDLTDTYQTAMDRYNSMTDSGKMMLDPAFADSFEGRAANFQLDEAMKARVEIETLNKELQSLATTYDVLILTEEDLSSAQSDTADTTSKVEKEVKKLTDEQSKANKVKKQALRLLNMEEGLEKDLILVEIEKQKRIREAEALYGEAALNEADRLELLKSKTRITEWATRETAKLNFEYRADERKTAEAAKEAAEEREAAAKKIQDALRTRVTGIIDSLKTERQVEDENHRQALKDLKDYYGSRVAFDKNYISTREKLEKKHQAKIRALQKQEYDKQFSSFENYQFNEMDLTKLTQEQKEQFVKDGARTALRDLSQHNKALFALNKAFAIKDAIVNTAQGVTKALAMGPVLGPIMAGIIGAMGVAQIATIASQQYTGRRFGGPVSNDDSYIVGENGPELFTPGATGRITANEGMITTGQTINFNITATDAKSVDELIVQRKPMIVNMIRQATQERGNRPNF